MGNPINQSAYLRTTRLFPSDDPQKLSLEINRAYIDIANTMNKRAIGLFSTSEAAISGKQYFTSTNTQQSLQKLFILKPNGSGSFDTLNHNISGLIPGQVVQAYGSFTDGTYDYGLLYQASTAIAGQIGFYISSSQIIFVTGSSPPTATAGKIIIEYFAQP